MSLALYRRYRPGTFAEVIGQDHVTTPLQQALRTGRLHHAYLFSGPRGCGKTSSARILARSLNCEQGPTPVPCGECESCVALAPNGPGSLDVIEIDAASHGGVDDARDLRERAFFAPVSSRYKIYIIDEAHMVSGPGWNALLKIVEEPPPHLKFVFATTEPEKVIGTIRSRTFHYPFRLVPPVVLREYLAGICVREGVEVEPLVFPLVVRAGAGSVRDSLSVLDQLIGGAGPEGVTYERAVALLGYTDAALLDEIVGAFAAGDGAGVFRAVDRAVDAGHDPRQFAADLLDRLRDLLLLAAVPDAAATGLLDLPEDAAETMRAQADRLGAAALVRAADVLNAGIPEMKGTVSARLQLELLCARILLPAGEAGTAAVLARLDRLERRLEIGGAPVVPAAAPAPVTERVPTPVTEPTAAAPVSEPTAPDSSPVTEPTASAPVPVADPAAPDSHDQRRQDDLPGRSDRDDHAGAAADDGAEAAPAPAPAGGLDAAAVRRAWPDVLDMVKSLKRRTHAMLVDTQVLALDGQRLTLEFRHAPIRKQYDADGENEKILRDALRSVLGVDWQVVTSVAGDPGRGGLPPGAAATGSGVASAPVTPAGFAPGDEPQDEPDDGDGPAGPADPVALLEQELGAKVIGEIDTT